MQGETLYTPRTRERKVPACTMCALSYKNTSKRPYRRVEKNSQVTGRPWVDVFTERRETLCCCSSHLGRCDSIPTRSHADLTPSKRPWTYYQPPAGPTEPPDPTSLYPPTSGCCFPPFRNVERRPEILHVFSSTSTFWHGNIATEKKAHTESYSSTRETTPRVRVLTCRWALQGDGTYHQDW